MSPTRTCAGCGRKREKSELMRFVGDGDVLTPGVTAAGRGVYTCKRLSCFERARAHRAFSRVLRRTVRVDSTLERLYTGVS